MIKSKKQDIIITSVIVAVVLAISIITGIQFKQFYKFEAFDDDYRDLLASKGLIDDIERFSDYSPSLKGTIGDSYIYLKYGKNNTVAVVSKSNAESYSTAEKIINSGATIYGDSTQLATVRANKGLNGKYEEEGVFTLEQIANSIVGKTASGALDGLKNGQAQIALVRYEDAKAFVKANDGYVVADATVENVPSVLVMGGTHPNEPSGQLTATVILENANVDRGILYVINELNKSAFSYSQPQEATAWYYTLTTANGNERVFKFGSRATNTVDQWPTPDVYTHSSGQQLSSSEVRNINRAYPGSVDGTYTERLAYAVTQLILQNNITMEVDLHEASPEYLTINACVAHDDAYETIASFFGLSELANIEISVEKSPLKMHGLTHRELGDYTNAYAFLCETSNASQGKFRGAFTDDLILYQNSNDTFYEKVANYDIQHGTQLLYARPVSINERVARHTLAISSIVGVYNDFYKCSRDVNVTELPDELVTKSQYLGEFSWNSVPSYDDLYYGEVGNYLIDVK